MRQITLDGRIGLGGATVKTTAKGKSYIRSSLANDTFINGTNKTDWFDVTCFDPYIVENKAKFLTKGRYVIVQGVLDSEVKNREGKIYLNQYVNAQNIELPSFGKRDDNDSEPKVSTYTGGTKSDQISQKPVEEVKAPVQEAPVVEEAAPVQAVVSHASPAGWANNDDDLPF